MAKSLRQSGRAPPVCDSNSNSAVNIDATIPLSRLVLLALHCNHHGSSSKNKRCLDENFDESMPVSRGRGINWMAFRLLVTSSTTIDFLVWDYMDWFMALWFCDFLDLWILLLCFLRCFWMLCFLGCFLDTSWMPFLMVDSFNAFGLIFVYTFQ